LYKIQYSCQVTKIWQFFL